MEQYVATRILCAESIIVTTSGIRVFTASLRRTSIASRIRNVWARSYLHSPLVQLSNSSRLGRFGIRQISFALRTSLRAFDSRGRRPLGKLPFLVGVVVFYKITLRL